MSVVASVSAGLQEAEKRAKVTRQTHAERWAVAVQEAEKQLDQITSDAPVPYGDFIRALAKEARVDIPMAKRVFDALRSRGQASYEFGQGVLPLKQTA